MIIDKTLQMCQLFKSVLATSPMVDRELKKIAKQIQLTPRNLPEYKSFIQSYNLGYEYAVQLSFDQISKLIAKLSQSNIKDEFARGISGEFVTAANLLFAEFKGPNELGMPIVARKDLVSIMAAKAYAKTEATKYGIRARLVPVWNIKHQSDSGIVAPFKLCSECRLNGYSGNGVSISFHTSLPIEAAVNVSKGELEIELSAPKQSFANGKNHELIHGLVTPYTVRAPWDSAVPFNKARDVKEILSGSSLKKFSKSFSGLASGKFTYESDNEFVDFFSYWQKIRQHSPLSLPMTLPFVSSVRKSSVRLEIDTARSEFKKALLKVKLFTQQPSELMSLISNPVEPQILQEIKSIQALNTANSLLSQSPATIVKVEAAIKEDYATKSVEGYAVIGYKQAVNQPVRSAAAFAGRLKQASTAYSILYVGRLKLPIVNVRWSKEEILNQPLELTYNSKLLYGPENDLNAKEKIEIEAKIHKTEAQTNSVKESPEFKRCAEEEQAGRKLSTICAKVRDQAGSLDRAQMTIALPHSIYQSRVLSTVEELIKAAFVGNCKQMQPTSQMPIGQVKLDFTFAKAGDLAHVAVKHRHDAYDLKNIRVPHIAQGVMPFNVRCPFNPIGDAILQKLSNKNAPATCRVEPSVIRTFDNRTYNYSINDCEHVLLTDGHRILPVAVLTRTIMVKVFLRWEKVKIVKVLFGQAKVEVFPEIADSQYTLKIKVNGQVQAINRGQLFVVKDNQTKETIAEIKHYQDGVYQIYAPLQNMHVITDGERVEIVAPQLLKSRALGLCGNMNGEEVADLTTPKKCIMPPKLAAVSYILNKNGNDSIFAHCPKSSNWFDQPDYAAYQLEDQKCTKEEIVKTQVLAIFEQVQKRTHELEERTNKLGGDNMDPPACLDWGEGACLQRGVKQYCPYTCRNVKGENGMGGIYGSESDDSGYEMEGGEKSARGMETRFGMVFGSGAGGKKRKCPKRNGYFSKADGGACVGRDELGLNLKKSPDNCQKACDTNSDCISFETYKDKCSLSSSCTYDLAVPDSSGQCLYVKQGSYKLVRNGICPSGYFPLSSETECKALAGQTVSNTKLDRFGGSGCRAER